MEIALAFASVCLTRGEPLEHPLVGLRPPKSFISPASAVRLLAHTFGGVPGISLKYRELFIRGCAKTSTPQKLRIFKSISYRERLNQPPHITWTSLRRSRWFAHHPLNPCSIHENASPGVCPVKIRVPSTKTLLLVSAVVAFGRRGDDNLRKIVNFRQNIRQ